MMIWQQRRESGVVAASVKSIAQRRRESSVVATVDRIIATTTVDAIGEKDPDIQTTFESSTYPVGCLSAYRDIRYELRNSANQVVPVDSSTLQNPPYDGPHMLNHVIAGASPTDCSSRARQGKGFTQALFSALYPDLQPDRYTLVITIAPLTSTPTVTLAPITLTVDNARHIHLDTSPH